MTLIKKTLYWPIALLTGIAWVFCGAMLAAHEWALDIETIKDGDDS